MKNYEYNSPPRLVTRIVTRIVVCIFLLLLFVNLIRLFHQDGEQVFFCYSGYCCDCHCPKRHNKECKCSCKPLVDKNQSDSDT
jgi:hypothetical protein